MEHIMRGCCFAGGQQQLPALIRRLPPHPHDDGYSQCYSQAEPATCWDLEEVCGQKDCFHCEEEHEEGDDQQHAHSPGHEHDHGGHQRGDEHDHHHSHTVCVAELYGVTLVTSNHSDAEHHEGVVDHGDEDLPLHEVTSVDNTHLGENAQGCCLSNDGECACDDSLASNDCSQGGKDQHRPEQPFWYRAPEGGLHIRGVGQEVCSLAEVGEHEARISKQAKRQRNGCS
mmetsp:Transcript_13984/g.30233  ORF Transcript_13984/g.30233 Transcript_13984/m.30233 type:complete len:228 (-) Transcript_13984:1256-1939(-)